MLVNNVALHYLFIVLLSLASIHLSITQTTDADTSPTEPPTTSASLPNESSPSSDSSSDSTTNNFPTPGDSSTTLDRNESPTANTGTDIPTDSSTTEISGDYSTADASNASPSGSTSPDTSYTPDLSTRATVMPVTADETSSFSNATQIPSSEGTTDMPVTGDETSSFSKATQITSSAGTTTTSTRGSTVLAGRPMIVYEVHQVINRTMINLNDPSDRLNFTNILSELLKPLSFNVGSFNYTNNNDGSWNVAYNVSEEAYTPQDLTQLQNDISNKMSEIAGSTTISNPTVSCGGDKVFSGNVDCPYCGTEKPCADFPESKCRIDEDRKNIYCECDRTKHFFRTNYEYDHKCARTAMLWWPQMLAICALVFLVLTLIFAFLMCLRRRHKKAKKAIGKTEVLFRTPQKNADHEYFGSYNPNQQSANSGVIESNSLRSRSIYPTTRSNDYSLRERLHQNDIYSSSNSKNVGRNIEPDVYREGDNRPGILRRVDNDFNFDKDGQRSSNTDRDSHGDNIFV